MKAVIRNQIWWTVLFGTAAVAVAVAQTDRLHVDRVRLIPVINSSQFVVTGEVTARTETEFTVLSRTSQLTTLQVTEDTSIIKGAVTIRLADVSVGDKVSVTAERAPDGKMRAVSVSVRVGNE